MAGTILRNPGADGAMPRRRFLSTAAAAGSAAVTAAVWPGTAQADPRRGGHFVLGLGDGSTTDSLDPATYSDNFMQCVGHALHNYLTEVAPNGELIGELATEWEASTDARVWTFRLREGVTFHNGKALEAADVVASLWHHGGAESQSAAKPIIDPIDTIEAPDPTTVVITLKTGDADLPFLMSDYHLPIMPAIDGRVDPATGIGCGAYVLDRFEPGIDVHVTRNPDYWKADRGWFDEVTFTVIKDVAARQNALITGQIHAMNRVDLKTIHLLQRHPEVTVEAITGGQHYTSPMITTAEPFTDNNVRMAIKHAVNRQQILDTILQGYGSLGNDHPISKAYRFHAADIPQREYDPDQAKFYLKQAGLDSLTIDLSASDAAFSGAVDCAVLIQESAKAANITVNVVREPADGYWSNVWGVKPWCMSYWGGRPTENWMFSIGYAEGAAWNATKWSHPRFNELLIASRAELDRARRAEMFAEMQLLLRDEGGVIIPVFADYIDGIRNEIGHGTIASNWDLDGLRVAERWWFKEA